MKHRRGNILVSVLIGVLAASLLGLTTDQILQNVYNSSDQSLNVTLSGGAAATSITVGTTTVVSGTSGRILYDNAGVLGEYAIPLAVANGGTGATSLTGSRCLQTNAGGTAIEVTGAACGSGTGTVTGTGTVGLVPDWTTTTALGDSLAYRISVPNAGATGTTVNKLAKFTSAGAAVITSAAETAGVLGIVHSGAGTTGSAVVTTLGAENCVSDNATTAGHYATVSASVAGDCSDTGSATFPVAGTQVIGIWTETGTAASRSMFFNTPDVASASSGGGGGGAKNPAGAAGDVQYRATGNNFAAESAFNYSASTDNLVVANGTTSASSALNLGSTTLPTGAQSHTGTATAASTGNNYGGVFASSAATGANYGVFAKANGTAAGTNVGGLFNASSSTEGTGAKNIAVMGTLTTTDPTSATYGNASFAGLFDGGTLPDDSSYITYTLGTLASGSSFPVGARYSITSSGSSSTSQTGVLGQLNAGYTGSGPTYGINFGNVAAGTGGNLNLNSGTALVGNIGIRSRDGVTATTGYNVGANFEADASSVLNVGIYAKVPSSAAGTNVGILSNAALSTEGTNLKNVAGWFTLTTTDPSAVADNVSIVLAAASDGTADIFRGYNTTTKVYSVTKDGNVATAGTITSSRTTDLGWSVVAGANTACNTTCTSACVVGTDAITGGFLACTDATADSCLCAGSS